MEPYNEKYSDNDNSITVTTQLRKENIARLKGGQSAVSLMKPKPKSKLLFLKENQQIIKKVKKLKSVMQQSKKTKNARLHLFNKVFCRPKSQQQRSDSLFEIP